MNPKLETLLDKIINKIENGGMNWRKTWKTQMPCNYITKRPYNGINLLNTMYSDFQSPYYLTFKQVQDLGGNVKKGSKGTEIVFWQPTTNTVTNSEGETEEKSGLIFRLYYVFNAEQIEGIEFTEVGRKEVQSVEYYEDVVTNMPCEERFVNNNLTLKYTIEDKACYMPGLDLIKLPQPKMFESDAAYLNTLFHESIHATGHKNRLNRLNALDQFEREGESYSVEELTAELGACFMCSHFGIENDIENSAAYIKGWSMKLKENKNMLMKAASAASKAMAYILQETEVTA